MGLSSALLAVALLCAAVPVATVGFHPPASLRDLEKVFVGGVGALVAGVIGVRMFFPLGFFGLVHLGYLLVVVTVPVLLSSWYVLGRLRRRHSVINRFSGLIAVIVALVGVWGTHIEPNWLTVDRVSVAANLETPIRIGVLADVQTPNVGDHENNAVRTLLAESPDIVVVPGDLYQGEASVLDANTADFVRLIRDIVDAGVVVAIVSGDSDSAERLLPIAEEAGALFIDNRIREVTIGGQPIRLAGVEVAQTPAQLNALAALTTPSDAFTVLVSHRPDIVYALPEGADVDLIVSGHTHGGQVSLPFFGPPVTFSDVPRSLAAGGLELVENYPVYVSSGVGLERLSAPQVRFGSRPSVGVIDVS